MDFDSDTKMAFGEDREVEIPFPIVPDATERNLSERELMDYTETRKDWIEWMLIKGKDTRDIEGYSPDTVKRTSYRVAYVERSIWNEYDKYIPILKHAHADQYIEELAYSDKSQSHKHKTYHSLKRYFKWRSEKYNEEEWEPARKFTSNGNGDSPQDYFTKKERFKLRQIALEMGSIPSYSTVDGERLYRLKPYVAEYRDKKEEDVMVADWDGVESWKITSLIWASLDAGFRPSEVGKAKVEWVDADNNRFLIPKEESTKNTENWKVAMREKTATALERWLHEREHYPKYDDSDKIWLTTHGGGYDPSSLRNLIHKACDKANIDISNRDVSWYSIRHSVGTYMTDDRDLASSQEQLRHLRIETTAKYDAAPVEDRTDSLDRMG